jgi:predicted DNA-binding transcriptional regulator YafY
LPLGTRESQWAVLRRCLAIIRRVQRGPAQWTDLVRAVCRQEGAEAYGPDQGDTQHRRLEKDLERIRGHLDIELHYDRRAEAYAIGGDGLPLLDLPDDDLATLAWLQQTFEPDAPNHDAVQALLDRLQLYLGPERREAVERQRSTLAVDLGQRDEDGIAETVWDGLTRALVQRRRIEFLYASPQQTDVTPRRHVVDPYERYFDTTRGHYYLRGWCRETQGPRGRRLQECYFDYRLGRMRDLQVLPDKLPPQAPPATHYAVEYELSPRVARLGVTRQPGIEILTVEQRPDGGALVHGRTTDPFLAVQSLLHYGPNCCVLGGQEVLGHMQAVVKRMAESYRKE